MFESVSFINRNQAVIPGDAAGIEDLRRLRLAAAVGSRERPSSRRPSPTENVTVTNRFCQLYRVQLSWSRNAGRLLIILEGVYCSG